MLNCGDAFLTGDGDEDNFHLWVIITPPNQGEVVTVCMVTAHNKSERLVVLNQNDHPFIKHETVIAYGFSRIRTVADIEELIKRGFAKQRESVSAALLKRIREGLLDSDFTPNGVRNYYREVTTDLS
jgi:hypothetical protein